MVAVLAELTGATDKAETGRKHQIRRHLAGIGHPVVGDVAYGVDREGDLQLVSVSLAIDNPDSGDRITCKLPDEMNSLQLS